MTFQFSSGSQRMKLGQIYLAAKEYVIRAGYANEVDWQDDLSFKDLGERDFLREGAWVILCSGMRESIIRRKFEEISKVFFQWDSASAIVHQKENCLSRALSIFGSRRKIEAIIGLAERVEVAGFQNIRERINREGITYLRTFSFMGPATAYHFGKNIGMDVVKPDRHLVRISRVAGFESPAALCQAINEMVGEKLAVVDLVLWRFATLKKNYLLHFSLNEAGKISGKDASARGLEENERGRQN